MVRLQAWVQLPALYLAATTIKVVEITLPAIVRTTPSDRAIPGEPVQPLSMEMLYCFYDLVKLSAPSHPKMSLMASTITCPIEKWDRPRNATEMPRHGSY